MTYLSKVHSVYYRYTNQPVIAGKSYVVNAAGHFYLYMADDCRKNPSTQIIVCNLGGGDLHLLTIDAKKEILIVSDSY